MKSEEEKNVSAEEKEPVIDTSVEQPKKAQKVETITLNSEIYSGSTGLVIPNLGVQNAYTTLDWEGNKKAYLFGDSLLFDNTFDSRIKLEETITRLRKELKEANDSNEKKDNDHLAKTAQLREELLANQKINHILTRISGSGREKLLDSKEFQDLFKNGSKYDSVVLSIDIRRSTELMLKARTPQLFSEFITELSKKLSQCIVENFGIFDKFTGDGILAFFPKFYSGENAIIRAIKASSECQAIFEEHYAASKKCFNVFITDVGLGIGIDYGNVTLVNTHSELTVVGIPVVYACRFSGAKAGETLFNQPAMEEVLKQCPEYSTVTESSINIKNEGTALGYNIALNKIAFKMEDPDWNELIKKYSTVI